MPDKWRRHARDLADFLAGQGLTDPAWIEAFAKAPRHEFGPRGETVDDTGAVVDAAAWTPEQRLARSYADQVMVTRFEMVGRRFGRRTRVATSSVSQPSIVAIMLQLLRVADGHRVLEIGTGPGYNACLLCIRLGEQNVTSMDIQADVVDEARDNLARSGFHPHLVTGDGAEGCPRRGPFDRIIATCALPRIPVAWLDQLAPDARVVAPMNFGGALAVLDLAGGRLRGGFAAEGGFFMSMRHGRAPAEYTHYRPLGVAHRRNTIVDSDAIASLDFRLWIELSLPGVSVWPSWSGAGVRPGVEVATSRGCAVLEVGSGVPLAVTEYGEPLWDTVERDYRRWVDHGRPGRERLGMAVTADRQWVWLDQPDSAVNWDIGDR